MKNCKYYIKKENGTLELIAESGIQLDNWVAANKLSNMSSSDFVFLKSTVTKRDSRYTKAEKILDDHLIAASITLGTDRENALRRKRLESEEGYENFKKEVLLNGPALEENIPIFKDGTRGVIEHIFRSGLVQQFDVAEFTTLRGKQLISKGLSKEKAAIEIQKEIASWTFLNKAGKVFDIIAGLVMTNGIHKYIKKLNGKYVFTNYEDFKINYESMVPDIKGINISDDLLTKFVQQVLTFKSKNYSSGDKIYSQYVIDLGISGPDCSTLPLRGKIDLMILKSDGSVRVFDYKTSTRLAGDLKKSEPRSSEWDYAKIDTVGYQMTYYKKMLEYIGIPYEKISTEIVPIQISGIEYDAETKEGSIERLDMTDPVSVYIDPVIYENVSSEIQISEENIVYPELFKEAKSDLSKMFPILETGNQFTLATLEYYLKNKIYREGTRYKYYKQVKAQHGFEKQYANTREEAEEQLEGIIRQSKEHLAKNTTPGLRQQLKNRLESFNQNANSFSLDPLFERYTSAIQLNLLKYFNDLGWRVMPNDDVLLDLNCIVLINTSYRVPQVDIIVLTNDHLDGTITINGNRNVLGKFVDDSYAEKHQNIMKSTVGSVELMRGMTILNRLSSALPAGIKVGDIKAMNLTSGHALLGNTEQLRYNFNMLTSRADIENNIGESSKYLSSIEQALNILLNYISDDNPNIHKKLAVNISSMLKQSLGLKSEAIQALGKTLSDTPSSSVERTKQSIQTLTDLWQTLNNSSRFSAQVSENDYSYEAYLYGAVAKALTDLSGLTLDMISDDMFNKYGFSVQDWHKKQILNGTYTNTIDTVPIIKNIHDRLQTTLSNLRNSYYNYKNKTRSQFRTLSGFVEDATLNTSMFAMKDFYDKSEEGKKRFLFKKDDDPSLSSKQQTFLKWYLEELNSHRFDTEEEIEKAKLNGTYWEVPLLKGSVYSKTVNGNNIVKTIKSGIKDIETNLRRSVDSRNEEESQLYKKSTLSDFRQMTQMYNIFKMDPQMRESLLSDGTDPMQVYETHLEEILDMYVLSKQAEHEYNKVLPGISAAITMMQLTGYMSGINTDATVEFINDYLRNAVFNEPLIDRDNKFIWELLAAVKQVSSKFILGFNMLSAGKEAIYGFFMNYVRASSNVMDKDRIDLKNMTKAYTLVWKDVMTQLSTISLLENINFIYGINNFDRNSMVGNENYNKTDPARFSDRLFWVNRAPDFLNRMVILTGYMMKRGCFDAHSLDSNNNLVYDWKKDKRFELYANNDKSDLEKYNFQRALYLRMMQEQVEVDHVLIYDESINAMRDLTMDDELPRAFTVKEVEAMKQESDMTFGYMDHDTKSLYLKAGIFNFLHQFMTFITGRKNQWLLKRGTYSQGKWTHATNENGEKMYWKQNEIHLDIRDETTEVTDDPIIIWEGKVMEGIFYSLIDLFNVFNIKKARSAWGDKVKVRNFLIALLELVAFFMLFLILSLWIGDTKNIQKVDNFAARNVATMMYRAANDLNVVNTALSSVLFDFPGFTWAGSVVGDLGETIFGDKKLIEVFAENTGALSAFKKDIKDSANEERKEARRLSGL